MIQNIEATLSAAFIGRACRTIRREYDWVFSFGEHRAIVVFTFWRIIVDQRVSCTDADHGHMFGHAEPVDCANKATRLLANSIVKSLTVHPLGDLTLVFENDVAVEIFIGSSGYEAWQADFPVGNQNCTVIGMGGGGLSTYSR